MLNKTGMKIFKLKYAKDENETWEDACLRVASYIASVEEEEQQAEWIGKYFQLIYNKIFIPGGRILKNAGTNVPNLMNCFVLPIEDSRKSIYKTLGYAADIFAHGGGIGYDFSKLRETGAPIRSIGGTASGPLSFMELFDTTGEIIQQASRRGAQMGMLRIDHPDIRNFISNKARLTERNRRIWTEVEAILGINSNEKLIAELGYAPDARLEAIEAFKKVLGDSQLTHFNISVILTDEFMRAVDENKSFDLKSPLTGEVVDTVEARKLFRELAQSAWESGDPGVFFYDRTNEDNMVKYLGNLTATNPCGEVPLLPYEPCCLGSINLYKFYDERINGIDYNFLEYVVRMAIRFLDNVQEVSQAPIKEINAVAKSLRRLGLGVMGWADLLAEMGLPYDSEEAIQLARKLSHFISLMAWSESALLAEERGTFSEYRIGMMNQEVIKRIVHSDFTKGHPKVKELPVRNVSVTSIAPTGSIALLAGVNSSIEPFYALSYTRNITEGVGNIAKDSIVEFNPILERKLHEQKITSEKIGQTKVAVRESGTLEGTPIPSELQEIFKTAHEIHWKDHIRAQSAWQEFTTNAVSKTINMPNEASVEDVESAFMEMWKAGLKGGTIYRDGSKFFQILNK